MMDWTDRHCRYFHRLIAPHVRLYTEMVTCGALLHGDAERFLHYDESEHPVALQLGGSDPADLATCARMGAQAGYDEINLNCGCPSDRVQKGRFGACLMAEPSLVANCVEAMCAAVDIPVTVKCRIGIDDQDSFEFLDRFVDTIADKGCKTFIIHARKAWLSGLSPKENRTKPPITYERAYAIKEKYPQLRIIVNGEIKSAEEITSLLSPRPLLSSRAKSRDLTPSGKEISPLPLLRQGYAEFSRNDNIALDGTMIGREAYQNPYMLADIERDIFKCKDIAAREDIALAMAAYAARQQEQFGVPVKSITRHILGLFAGQPGAKQWKRTLSTLPYETGAGSGVILQALEEQQKAAEKQARAA